MSDGDWLRLHRKWLDCPALHDHTARGWWATILSYARWGAGTFKGHEIKPGEFGCSLRIMAEKERVERNTLRHWLRHFESKGMIEIRQVGQGRRMITVIRVVNWSRYQSLSGVPNSPTTVVVGEPIDPQANPQTNPQADPLNKKDKEGEESIFCDEAAKRPSSPPAAIDPTDFEYPSFPCAGSQQLWKLKEQHIARLSKVFEGVDVPAEALKAHEWTLSNPTKRKTARGMPRFLYGWMERVQNRGGSRVIASTVQQPSIYRDLTPRRHNGNGAVHA